MSEVRKRALDEDSTTQDGGDDQSTKRVAKEQEQELYNVESVMVMKLLCPSSIIGAIIGRGGNHNKNKNNHHNQIFLRACVLK